jgi:hypothetical protein
MGTFTTDIPHLNPQLKPGESQPTLKALSEHLVAPNPAINQFIIICPIVATLKNRKGSTCHYFSGILPSYILLAC